MGERGFGHIYERNGIWWIKYHRNGEAFYESSKSRIKEDAKKLLRTRLNEKHRRLKTTVGELLSDLLLFYRVHRPKSYDKFARPFIEATLKPYWDKYTADQVTTPQITAYQLKRKKQGAAEATINRELALLRRAFRYATESTPPKVSHVPKFNLFVEQNTRSGFISHAEYKDLLAQMPEELKPLLVVAYHTGARRGELLKIRWRQVDLEAGEILLKESETKAGEARTLPLYGESLTVLRCHHDVTKQNWPRCTWVFHRAGRPIKDFRDSWDQACVRAGLPGLLFHDLRRTAVRNLVRAGVSEKVAMEISGHKTREIFKRYDITDAKDIRSAGKKLNDFLNG